jgi:hypothetical protein
MPLPKGLSRQLSLFLPIFGIRVSVDEAPARNKPLRPPIPPTKKQRVPGQARQIARSVTTSAEQMLLERIWFTLRTSYFPDREDLDSYALEWSGRKQKRVLASCNIKSRRIRVARELLEPCAVRWLEAVVYHEMCHAVIGYDVMRSGSRRMWHGRQFRELELRHPDIPALEQWMMSGGWHSAVRSNRARAAWKRRIHVTRRTG